SELPKSIRALTSHRDRTFAAFGTDIAVFYRSHQSVHALTSHRDCTFAALVGTDIAAFYCSPRWNWVLVGVAASVAVELEWVRTLKGHRAKVRLLLCVWEYLLSVDEDRHVLMWLVGTFKGHRAKVRLLLVLGECLLSVDEQRHVLLWPVGTLKGHKAKIKLLLVFGEYLISVDENRHVLMWPEGFVLEPLGQFQLPEGFNPTGVIHPDTYLNKLLFASEDGRMQLWNVNSRKLLYEFKGWGVGITALVGSPALDTVAVGCSDGKVHVHNIRLDRPVVDFTHAAAGAVTSLAFNSDGPPLLAVGGMGGAISVWDLTNRRLHSIIPDAHDGRVAALSFLVNEPLLLSAGADNSLKPPLSIHLTKRHLHSIIPDTHDGRVAALSFLVNEPLLLSAGFESTQKQASLFCSLLGQTTASRYYRNGRHILITFLPSHPITLHPTPPSHLTPISPRSYRIAPHPTQRQVREGGGRKEPSGDTPLQEEKLKLSKVVCIDAVSTAPRGVPVEEEASNASPLSFPLPAQPTRCVRPACAANFALVGTSSGHLHLFHLQSARHRVAYQSEKMQYSPAHGGMVTGAAIDALNRQQHQLRQRWACQEDAVRVRHMWHGDWRLLSMRSTATASTATASAAAEMGMSSINQQPSPGTAFNGHSINGHSINGHSINGHSINGPQHQRAQHQRGTASAAAATARPSSNRLREFHDLHLRRRGWPAGSAVPGHEDRITAVEVSPDGRWLLTSAMDLTVRTWHVVSGRPLDAFQVPTAVVGLSMSPTSDLLATIHLNRRGIYLWANKAMANKAMYSGIDDSDLLPVPPSLPAATATDGTGTNSSVPAVQMPILIGPNEGAEGEEEDEEGRRVGGRGVGTGDVAVIAGEGGGGRAGVSGGEGEVGRGKSEGGTRAEYWTAEEAEREARDYETSAAATAAAAAAAGGSGGGAAAAAAGENQQQNQELQLQVPGLISRAMLPRSQWVNLVMLDVIKERNRPIQPPKKPEQAPFFLPSVPTFSGAIHFAPPQAAAAVAAGSAEPAGSAGSAEPTGSTAAAADGVAGASGGSSGGALPGWGSEGDAEMEEGEEEEGEEGSEEGRREERKGRREERGQRREGRRGLMRAIRRGAQCDPADYSQATALLKVMSPSAVDLELRAIEIVDDSPSPADLHRVALFMSFLEGKLRGSCDFELLQAVTHRFLAIHGSAISSFPQLRAKLPALKEAQASSWQRLDELFQSIRCVVDFIASS
ncbi:unnamed protein product, partial [Closterium sp. NIES-64]